jgi:hypothetical protein
MKNATLKPNFKQFITLPVILLLLLSLSMPALAAKEGDREMKSSIKFDGRPNVSVILYDSETTIKKATGNEITVSINYIAEGLDEGELQTLQKSMKENLIQKSGNKITISTRFYESYQSFVIIGIRKTKLKLKNGEELSMSKFKVTNVEITLPDDMDLNLNSKYNEVKLGFDIKGDLEIKGYDLKYYGKNNTGKLTIDGRYSTFNLGNTGDANLKFYESHIEFGDTKDLDLDIRYSKIKMQNCSKLTMKSYEDKYEGTINGDADIDAKYTDLKIKNVNNIKAKMYEGTIALSKVNENFTFDGRYVEMNANYINSLNMHDGYENNIKIEEVSEIISKNGKYNDFDVDKLANKLEIDGYEDEIEIDQLSDNFSKIQIDGKYIDVNIGIIGKPDYRLHGSISYPDLNINMSDYSIILNEKKSSRLDFKYYRGNENAEKEIYLKGYEIDARISNN